VKRARRGGLLAAQDCCRGRGLLAAEDREARHVGVPVAVVRDYVRAHHGVEAIHPAALAILRGEQRARAVTTRAPSRASTRMPVPSRQMMQFGFGCFTTPLRSTDMP
jgi:hypothetical protein